MSRRLAAMRLRAASMRSPPVTTRYRTIASSAVAHDEPRRPSAYTPPQSTYVPPVPTAQTFSSSGDPTDSHPMPSDMPREDYMGPLAYTTSLLGRLIKYLLLASIGVGAASVLALEGGHQYIERICLAGMGPTSPEDARYAWQLEHDDWSGGERGGTDPALGFWIRHLLRSAWVCQELGGGMSGTIGSEAGAGALGDAGVKGMIGSGALGPGGGGYVNRVDRGYELAESYIAQAIALAERSGAATFPPHLSIQRTPLAHTTDLRSAILTDKERLGLALLLRHADVLERIGTRTALTRAQETYERILRFAVENATPSVTSGKRMVSGDDVLSKARAAIWARKLGDLGNRLGEERTARQWWTWGLGSAGIEGQAGPASTLGEAPAQPTVSHPPKKTSWFSGWSRGAQPSESMQQTLAANAEVIPHQHGDSGITPEVSQPPLLRATVSLLSTYAAHLAQSGDLASAEAYERTAFALLDKPVAAGISQAIAATPAAGSAAGRLQRIWERQRTALLQLHLAEIQFARAADVGQGLRDLSRAVRGAEASVGFLAGTAAAPSADADYYFPHDAPPIHPAQLAGSFSPASRANALAKPAQNLLKDSQRTAAQGWYLSGALYERSARRGAGLHLGSSLPTSDPRELQELAFECYDRAVQWHRLADGGGEDEDAAAGKTAFSAEAGDERGRYWRAYARMRSALEEGVVSRAQ